MIKNIAKKMSMALLVTVVFFACVEGGLRLINFHYSPPAKVLWKPSVAGFMGTYEFFSDTEMEEDGYIWRLPPHTPITDKRGFRLPGVPDVKAPDKKRIAFLGGSTTQGGNYAFPELTILLLNRAIKTNRYEHLNASCSAYSTHQSLLALKRWVLPLNPDHVVIYHGWNDAFLEDDGFSDREKEAVTHFNGDDWSKAARWVKHSRIAQALGWLMQRFDYSWPRPRVSMKQFESNLREMVKLCEENGISVSLVLRPISQKRPLPNPGENYSLCYERIYNTRDLQSIYRNIHSDQLEVMHRIADDHDHVELIDACRYVNDLQVQQERGMFGAGNEIFREDACHLYSFANQKLAEYMALQLAGEDTDAVSNRINGVEYNLEIAEDFLRNNEPFAATYYAKQACDATDDTNIQRICTQLVDTAKSQYEFARLFNEARHGGSDTNFARRIEKLRKCQAMRPHDIGVCLQILRVCHYEGRAAEAVSLMDLYRPTDNPRERYEYLSYLFHSHTEGERWMDAAKAAREMLRIRPNDQYAKDYLDSMHIAYQTELWSMEGPVEFSGCCDASAGVAVDRNLFVVADDESNILRVYHTNQTEALCAIDLGPFFKLTGKHTEADLEACAQIGEHVFWIGSHGRSKKGKKRPARCLFFDCTFVVETQNVECRPNGVLCDHLLQDLLNTPHLKSLPLEEASKKAPKRTGGLNIEGLCATENGTLLIGFRNPIIENKALVIPLLNPLDVVTEGASALFGNAILLDLGGLGIRGMKRFRDQYVLIAGSHNGEGESRLYRWDGQYWVEPIDEISLSGINPEGIVAFTDSFEDGFMLLSDDGTTLHNGKPCKELKTDEQKCFRTYWVKKEDE